MEKSNPGKILRRLRFKVPLEAAIWLGGLLSLLFLEPALPGHFSLCLFKNLGFENCPGCGLGHAIAYLYRGELLESFQAHPLGIPAFMIIFSRSLSLLFKSFSQTTHS